MNPPIDIIGIGADGSAGLRPELIERIHAAEFLAGGERHQQFFPSVKAERFVIKDNLAELTDALRERQPRQRCVVLASGDPLFYGVGTYLAPMFRPGLLRIEPTLSSMQLAFARAGIAWQDAVFASVHGRDLRSELLPLLGWRLIGLFTADGDSPAAVADFFRERGIPWYQAVVAENLGRSDERVTRWSNLEELQGQHFAPLNYLILKRISFGGEEPDFTRNGPWQTSGLADEHFARPDNEREVMTRQEVRAIVLAKAPWFIAGRRCVWDVGAGLGTVSVEMAHQWRRVEIVAVERDPARVAFLHQNRKRFDAYNIRVVAGEAPAALENEIDRPSLVFIGGSGGQLEAILECVAAKLEPGGRLLANFVTLEHLSLTLQRLRRWSWQFEVTELQVARSDPLAGLTGLKPQRGVFIVSADKPDRP